MERVAILQGRAEIKAFLTQKWKRERDYRRITDRGKLGSKHHVLTDANGTLMMACMI